MGNSTPERLGRIEEGILHIKELMIKQNGRVGTLDKNFQSCRSAGIEGNTKQNGRITRLEEKVSKSPSLIKILSWLSILLGIFFALNKYT